MARILAILGEVLTSTAARRVARELISGKRDVSTVAGVLGRTRARRLERAVIAARTNVAP